jgi:hypothetical protein
MSNDNTPDVSNWWGSKARARHCKAIKEVPLWRRLLIAKVLERRAAKSANSLACAAVRLMGHDSLFAALVVESDRAYARLFGTDTSEIPETGRLFTLEEMNKFLKDESAGREQYRQECARLRNLCRAMRSSFRRRHGREGFIQINWP